MPPRRLSMNRNLDKDQVLFVCLGAEAADASIRIEALGRPYAMRSRVTSL